MCDACVWKRVAMAAWLHGPWALCMSAYWFRRAAASPFRSFVTVCKKMSFGAFVALKRKTKQIEHYAGSKWA